jgi:cyclic-di-GMP-binding protein
MPSFDVVSELDLHEVRNGVDQARRELETRFDFRGVEASFELEEAVITMTSEAEFQVKQMYDILRLKLTKRGVDISCIELKDPEINLARCKQVVILRQGIDADAARKIQRAVKDSKIKVQAAIQGDKVRVTGKSRDDLQATIAMLRAAKLDLPLQFNNFRD